MQINLPNDWHFQKMTQNQRLYIAKIIKEHPELPPFTGQTKGEAAEYIEKCKSINRKERSNKKEAVVKTAPSV